MDALFGTVLDIDRFTTHDGPGIRMTVFLKGCPLRCLWCHSPESQSPRAELLYQKARCQACFRCVASCPSKAIQPRENGIAIDRDRCRQCYTCVGACCHRALRKSGRSVQPSEILELALRDRPYYEASGGGVTISGGEPLMQADFTLALLRGLREAGIHTAIETSGMGQPQMFREIARIADLIFFDVKTLDPEKHSRFTGVDNARIIGNLRTLCEDEAIRKKLYVRTPMIPGLNDGEDEIREIARFVQRLGIPRMDVLPYNALAAEKYDWIGAPYPLADESLQTQDNACVEKMRRLLREHNLNQTL